MLFLNLLNSFYKRECNKLNVCIKGCGVNLSNQNPTICINDLIEKLNKKNESTVPPLSYEKYFAVVFNEIERLYKIVQNDGFEELMHLYYSYWLHT